MNPVHTFPITASVLGTVLYVVCQLHGQNYATEQVKLQSRLSELLWIEYQLHQTSSSYLNIFLDSLMSGANTVLPTSGKDVT
jgi:hypothetical protein